MGFLFLCIIYSVYSGHHSILIPPSEVEVNPSLWLSAVSQYKVRDTFCSYGVMELCTKGLGSSVGLLKQRSVNLACVRYVTLNIFRVFRAILSVCRTAPDFMLFVMLFAVLKHLCGGC